MYCMTCGSKISSQAKFCTSCGSPAPHTPDASEKTADSAGPSGLAESAAAESIKAEPATTANTTAENADAATASATTGAESATAATANPAAESPTIPGEPASLSQGANAPDTAPEQLTFAEAMDKQKHKSRRRIPTLLLIVLVVLALSGIAYAAHTIYRYYVKEINPPITTVEEFTRALDEKDAEGAISCMDESTRNHYDAVFSLIDGVGNSLGLNLSDGASRSAFSQLAHDFFPSLSSLAGENIDYHISIATSSQSIDGNTAHVSGAWHVELISGDEVIEKDEPFTFNLVLERGAWRILYDETFREN